MIVHHSLLLVEFFLNGLFLDPLDLFIAAPDEGVGNHSLVIEYRSLIQVVKLWQCLSKSLPVLRHKSDARVTLQIQSVDLWHLLEEREDFIPVIDLVVLQVQRLERWQLQ